MVTDNELLRQYVASQSDHAFEQLVSRHIQLVYSAARRQVTDPAMAEEVTQAVFVLLAQKARSLSPDTIVAGWLHRATRFVALRALRTQHRRRHREHEAFMQTALDTSSTENAWNEMFPLVDELLGQLRASDRDALVLRYFENRTVQEVAEFLGVEHAAAQKRVARGLEKLRRLFVKRGVIVSATVIAAAVTSHAAEAAPIGLAASAVAAAKGSAAATPIVTLADGGAKAMHWAAFKIPVAIAAAIAVSLLGVDLAVTHQAAVASNADVTEVAVYDLFTNYPIRFNAGKYGYGISGNRGLFRNEPTRFDARAEWFVPNTSGRLSTIEIAVQRWQPAGINVSLTTDDKGQPGKVLEKFDAVLPPMAPPPGEPNPGDTLLLKSKARPSLKAGVKYWLCLEAADRTTTAEWWPTSLPNTDNFVDAVEPGRWRPQPPGSQRPGWDVAAALYRKTDTKAAFAVTVQAPNTTGK